MRLLLAPLLCLGLGAQAPPAPGPRSGTDLRVGPATLHYREQGAGPLMVLLSGGPGFANYLDSLAEGLAARHRCILPDQRGTGKSTVTPLDGSTLSIAVLVEDLEALRRHLGAAKWTVLGHSWGAMLGMAYAAAHPEAVQSLVLLDSGGMTMDFAPVLDDNIHGRLLPSDLETEAYWRDPERKKADPDRAGDMALQAVLPGYFYDRAKAARVAPLFRTPGFMSRPMAGVIRKELGSSYDLREAMKRMGRPTLVIQGRQDPMDPSNAYELHLGIPGSKLAFIEKAGHFPWVEQPEATFQALESFLPQR